MRPQERRGKKKLVRHCDGYWFLERKNKKGFMAGQEHQKREDNRGRRKGERPFTGGEAKTSMPSEKTLTN